MKKKVKNLLRAVFKFVAFVLNSFTFLVASVMLSDIAEIKKPKKSKRKKRKK